MLLEFYTITEVASVTQMLISSIDSGLSWILVYHVPLQYNVWAYYHSTQISCCHTEHCGDTTSLINPKTIEQSVLDQWIDFTCWCYGCSRGGLSLPRALPRGHLCFLTLTFPPFSWEAGLTSLCLRLLVKCKLDQACQISGKVKLCWSV